MEEPSYTYEQLKEFVYGLPITQTLSAIGRRLEPLYRAGGGSPDQWRLEPPWGLVYLAGQVLLHGSELGITRPSDTIIDKALDMYKLMEEPQPEPGEELVPELLIRMSYEQFPHQEPLRELVPRTLALFETLPRSAPATGDFEIDDALRATYGMPLRDFMRGVFAIGSCVRNGAARRSNLVNSIVTGLSHAVQAKELDQTLGLVRTTFSGYRDLQKTRSEQFPTFQGLEKYAYNPLLEKPVVSPDGESDLLLVPSQLLLWRRATSSVYYDLISRYGESFANWFGGVVEAYVEKLLTDHWKGLFRERDFKTEGTPDFAVRVGDTAVLIECKSGRLTQAARGSGKPAVIKRDLARSFQIACRQLQMKEAKIYSRSPGFEPLFGVKKVHPVIVTLEPFYMANADPLRDVVDSLMKDDGLAPVDYQALTVQELETISHNVDAPGFVELLNRKTTNVGSRLESFEDFLQDDYQQMRAALHPYLKLILKDFHARLNVDVADTTVP